MSVAKTRQSLTPPIAPLPNADHVGKPSGEPAGAPRIGERLTWQFHIEFPSTLESPHGREVAEHIRTFLRRQGFTVAEPTLLSLAQTVPFAIRAN